MYCVAVSTLLYFVLLLMCSIDCVSSFLGSFSLYFLIIFLSFLLSRVFIEFFVFCVCIYCDMGQAA